MFKPWLGLLLAIPATAQWSRVAFSGKGESADVPQPHSLSYFTANPFLRDDGGDLCVDCSPQGRAKSALEYSIQPLVRPVGVLAGYRVLDVLYSVGKRSDPSRNEVSWKSILVQVGPDRYKEIFHLQASGGPPSLKPPALSTRATNACSRPWIPMAEMVDDVGRAIGGLIVRVPILWTSPVS